MQKNILTNNIMTILLVAALLMLATPAMAEPTTPFRINGHLYGPDGNPCNAPYVHITNLNTNMGWNTENTSISNYYRLEVTSDDMNVEDPLQLEASGCDMSKTANHTVTSLDIEAGGFTLDTTFSHGDPDLILKSIEPTTAYVGQANLIRATIENNGGGASAFDVAMKIDGVLIGTRKVWSLGAHEETIISVMWTPTSSGTFGMTANADSCDVIVESNETNNGQTVMVDIFQPKTICVPENYGTIQKAIDNAANGTVITVSPNGAEDTYLEHVTIHEDLSCIWLIANGTVVIRNDASGGSSDPPEGDQVTVLGERCTVQGFDLRATWTGVYSNWPGVGVRLCSDGNIVVDNHIYYTSGGINIEDSSSYNVIENNTIGPGILGVMNVRGDYNLIANNSCGEDTGNGCPLCGTHDTITGNVFEGYVNQYSGSGNLLYNNRFTGATMNSANTYNVTKTPGTNIMGGPYLGGNYWVKYSGVDENRDGIGDTPYSRDQLPLVEWTPLTPLVGDVNGDGVITSADAAIVLQMAVCGEVSEEADVSGDDQVTSLDALMILQQVI